MKNAKGFTLIELLISLGLLGGIIVALFQTMGNTTQVSNSTNSSNDLIREGQIGQQLLSAQFKEACYVYPAAATVTMGSSGYTTRNGAGYTWTVNTHPIVALILPPASSDASGKIYRFFAYYAIPRSQYVSGSTPDTSTNPGPDVTNDSTTWMLMEYGKTIDTSNTTNFPTPFNCAQLSANSNFTILGGNAALLTDYITPVTTSTDLFSVGGTAPIGGAAFINYNLRLSRTTREGNTVTVGGGSSGTTMTAKVYPVNLLP